MIRKTLAEKTKVVLTIGVIELLQANNVRVLRQDHFSHGYAVKLLLLVLVAQAFKAADVPIHQTYVSGLFFFDESIVAVNGKKYAQLLVSYYQCEYGYKRINGSYHPPKKHGEHQQKNEVGNH